MKYLGSKKALLPHITQILSTLPLQDKSIIDVFTGTTRCAQAFRKMGFKVQASDLSWASQDYAETYLRDWDVGEVRGALSHLSSLPGIEGWLTQHYSSGACQVFQPKNTQRADRIRDEIEVLFPNLKAPLVTSLILALDAVDSTVGVQQAYLKKWSSRSFNELNLRTPRLISGQPEGKFYLGDALTLDYEPASVAYLDPPYSAHSYQTYYHIWDSVSRWDKPAVGLKTNRRADRIGKEGTRSLWNLKSEALKATEDLMEQLPVDHIILSYNDESLIPKQDLFDFINARYENTVLAVDYKRNIMSSIGNVQKYRSEFKTENQELLILINKGK